MDDKTSLPPVYLIYLVWLPSMILLEYSQIPMKSMVCGMLDGHGHALHHFNSLRIITRHHIHLSLRMTSASIRYPFDETLGSVIFHDYHKHINLKRENNMHTALSSETQ